MCVVVCVLNYHVVHRAVPGGWPVQCSAYASDAVKALATALHNCFQNQNNIDSCKGTQLEWNITFNGQTVYK